MRVHTHDGTGRGRFRRAFFSDLFSSVLCTRHYHNYYYYNNYNYFSTHPRTPTSRWCGGVWREQRKTQHRYYFCIVRPYANVRSPPLSPFFVRRKDVIRTCTRWTSPFPHPHPNSHLMMMMMTIEIRAICAWWPCATSLIVWTNKAPCTFRWCACVCVYVYVCVVYGHILAFINHFCLWSSRVKVSVRTQARLMTRTSSHLNENVITRTLCSSTLERQCICEHLMMIVVIWKMTQFFFFFLFFFLFVFDDKSSA